MLVVLFKIGEEAYALDALEVESVVPVLPVRPLAGAPQGVLGTCRIFDSVVPVLDLSAMTIGKPARKVLSSRYIIVHYPLAQGRSRLLGLLAEEATEAAEIAEEEWLTSGVAIPGKAFLGPLAQHNGQMVQRVDVSGLIHPDIRSILFAEDC